MRTRGRDREQPRLGLRAGGPLLIGSAIALITLGLLTAVDRIEPVGLLTSHSSAVNSSVVRTQAVVLTTTLEAGPTATMDATTTQTSAPLDLGSDAGNSSGGGLSNGHVAVIVIGSALVAALIAAALIGRRRRGRN